MNVSIMREDGVLVSGNILLCHYFLFCYRSLMSGNYCFTINLHSIKNACCGNELSERSMWPDNVGG